MEKILPFHFLMQRLARAFLYDFEIVKKDLFFFTEVYSELSQKSRMELFPKKVNGF